MRSQKILLLCVTVSLLAACSRSGSRLASSTEDSASSLVAGTYSTGCAVSGPTYAQLDIVVTATTLEYSNTLYYDAACTQPRVKFSYEDTYVDVAASVAQSGARDINVTAGKLYYTLLSASAVSNSNNVTECGFSDWTLNVPKDVSSTSCEYYPAGTPLYTIARTVNDEFEVGYYDSSDPTAGTTSNLRINYLSQPVPKQ